MSRLVYHISSDKEQGSFFKSICEELSDVDYLSFTNVDELVKNILIKKPDLVLLHLEIDENSSNGYALIKELRGELNYGNSILCLSKKVETHVISYSLYLGANDYIILPADEHYFLDRIQREISKKIKVYDSFVGLTPPLQGKVYISLSPIKVDVSSLYFESETFIAKKTDITIEHPLLYDIFKKSRMTFNVVDIETVENDTKQIIKVSDKNPTEEYYQNLRTFLLKWNR